MDAPRSAACGNRQHDGHRIASYRRQRHAQACGHVKAARAVDGASHGPWRIRVRLTWLHFLEPIPKLGAHERPCLGGRWEDDHTLVREGLRRAKEAGAAFAVVLGEPAYCSRFGFEPALRWGLTGEYGGGEVFQAIVWAGTPPPGLVKYAPEYAMFG